MEYADLHSTTSVLVDIIPNDLDLYAVEMDYETPADEDIHVCDTSSISHRSANGEQATLSAEKTAAPKRGLKTEDVGNGNPPHVELSRVSSICQFRHMTSYESLLPYSPTRLNRIIQHPKTTNRHSI